MGWRTCVAGVALFGAVGVSACGPSVSRRGAAAASDVISATELEQHPSEDLLAIVQRLRPAWLQARPSLRGEAPNEVVIVLDGVPQAPGVSPLRGFMPADVAMLVRLSPADATTRYGTGMPAGAILVTTKHR